MNTVQIAVLEGSPTWNLSGLLAASCQVSTLPFHAKSVCPVSTAVPLSGQAGMWNCFTPST